MKTCSKCNNPGQGKFCGKCGGVMIEEISDELANTYKTCPSCNKQAVKTAKFCGSCGYSFINSESSQNNFVERAEKSISSSDLKGSRIVWTLDPGVVALRLTEAKMDRLITAKGIIIREGTKALVYADGKFVSEFTEGEYIFKDLSYGNSLRGGVVNQSNSESENGESTRRNGGLLPSLRGVAQWAGRLFFGEKIEDRERRLKENEYKKIKEEEKKQDLRKENNELSTKSYVDDFISAVHSKKAISIILARSGDFRLFLNYESLKTSTISLPVGIESLFKIKDLTQFYKSFLTDVELLTFSDLQNKLSPILDLEVSELIRKFPAEEIEQNRSLLGELVQKFNNELQSIYPSIEVTHIYKISAKREELDRLEKLYEKIYISKKELQVKQDSDEVLNLLRLDENKQLIISAKNDFELQQRLREISKDKILGEHEFAKYIEMLRLDASLSNAKTNEDKNAILHEYDKKGFLRNEELELLSQQKNYKIGQAIELLQMRGDMDSRRLRLEIDSSLGVKEIELELSNQRRKLLASIDFLEIDDQIAAKKQEGEISRRRASIEAEIEIEKMKTAQEAERQKVNRVNRIDDLDVDILEQNKLLDLAERAEKMALVRKQKEKELELAELEVLNKNELLFKDKEIEASRMEVARFAGMSAEQIMAANKDISAEAARALAARGVAEAAAKNADAEKLYAAQRLADLEKQAAFVEKQTEKTSAAMKEMMLAMMQSNAAIAGAQIKQKDGEVERVLASNDKTVVQLGNVASNVAAGLANARVCKKCSTIAKDGNVRCTECGDVI